MRLAMLFFCAALSVQGQTNVTPASFPGAVSNSSAKIFQDETNQNLSDAQLEKLRADCIESRRVICGKILKVLPDGLVIDSGYADLARDPLNRSWLAPGTVTVTRATNIVEGNQAESMCIGFVFLTDIPKKRGMNPKLYDYVNLEGFPTGQYTYTSVGNVQRIVRKFSTKLAKSIEWKMNEAEKQNAPIK
jgi:hypothetical protein